MLTKIARLILLILAGTALLGCAAPTRISSVKADGDLPPQKRLAVITDIGTEFGQWFFVAFQKKTTELATNCGSEVIFSRITPLELDPEVHIKRVKEFNADSVLSIRRAGGTRTESGNITHVIYDSRLFDGSMKKIFWRSQADFYRGAATIPVAKRAETLAIELTNKMKADGLFSGCPQVQDPN